MKKQEFYEPSDDSFLLQEAVEKHAFGKFLDIGTGSGIQGFTALKKKEVKEVWFVDLNEKAIYFVDQRLKELKIENPKLFEKTTKVLKSDLFLKLKDEKFDCIAFNPPYLPTAKKEKLKGSINKAFDGGKDGRKITDNFLKQFSKHLNENGIVLLVDSSLAKHEKSIAELERRGFECEVVGRKKFFFEEIVVIKASKRQINK